MRTCLTDLIGQQVRTAVEDRFLNNISHLQHEIEKVHEEFLSLVLVLCLVIGPDKAPDLGLNRLKPYMLFGKKENIVVFIVEK